MNAALQPPALTVVASPRVYEQDVLRRARRLLAGVPDRQLVDVVNAAGSPEIRLPDSHPGRGRHAYVRPILRVITNGPGSRHPTDLAALARLLAAAPGLIEGLADTLTAAQTQIAALREQLARQELPIADETALKADVRKALWHLRESPDAMADRAIELVRRYLPAPRVIERERTVAIPRSLLSPADYTALVAAIGSVGEPLDTQLVAKISAAVLGALNLVVQEP